MMDHLLAAERFATWTLCFAAAISTGYIARQRWRDYRHMLTGHTLTSMGFVVILIGIGTQQLYFWVWYTFHIAGACASHNVSTLCTIAGTLLKGTWILHAAYAVTLAGLLMVQVWWTSRLAPFVWPIVSAGLGAATVMAGLLISRSVHP